MLITSKQLKNADVETKNGQYLGKVVDFEMQTDNSEIIKFYVATKLYFPGIYQNKLLISKDQIIDFTEDKIIVEDNVAGADVRESLVDVKKVESTDPVITSEGD